MRKIRIITGAFHPVTLESQSSVQQLAAVLDEEMALRQKVATQQPAVADVGVQMPVGDEVAGQVISLPMHPYLSQAEHALVHRAVTATR